MSMECQIEGYEIWECQYEMRWVSMGSASMRYMIGRDVIDMEWIDSP